MLRLRNSGTSTEMASFFAGVTTSFSSVSIEGIAATDALLSPNSSGSSIGAASVSSAPVSMTGAAATLGVDAEITTSEGAAFVCPLAFVFVFASPDFSFFAAAASGLTLVGCESSLAFDFNHSSTAAMTSSAVFGRSLALGSASFSTSRSNRDFGLTLDGSVVPKPCWRAKIPNAVRSPAGESSVEGKAEAPQRPARKVFPTRHT